MAINLTKGGSINLSKEAAKTGAGLTMLRLGLGWNPRQTDGEKFDLDASAFRLNAEGKSPSEADFIYFNMDKIGGKIITADGSVEHTGDNKDGGAAGDDESIKVDLTKLPAAIAKVAFTVTIYDATARRQNFGMVGGAYIRVLNVSKDATGKETETELARYDLTEDYSTETALVFGEVYRHEGEWKFKAKGEGFATGLEGLVKLFGLA